MKLLRCDNCGTIFNLNNYLKHCDCGRTCGQYEEDGLHAWFSGPATPLGFQNASFQQAVADQKQHDNNAWNPVEGFRSGVRFEAFIIPMPCNTLTKKEPDALSENTTKES